MHLAAAEDNLLSTRQIAEIHDAKYNHLAKITHWLARHEYVESVRGRAGGLRLAKSPDVIMIGEVLRRLESNSVLVECLRTDGGTCVLSPACRLTKALGAAQEAFYEALDDISLASVSSQNSRMSKLLEQLNSQPSETVPKAGQ